MSRLVMALAPLLLAPLALSGTGSGACTTAADCALACYALATEAVDATTAYLGTVRASRRERELANLYTGAAEQMQFDGLIASAPFFSYKSTLLK